MSLRFWFPLQPDIYRPIGGVKQVHRIAEAFSSLGCPATIIQDSKDFHPGWFSSNVTTISGDEWSVISKEIEASSNVVVIPETYISHFNLISPNLPKIIFNQNSSYTFGLNPKKLIPPKHIFESYHSPMLKHVLCVSHYDYQFLTDCIQLPSYRVSRIVNSIDFPVQPRRFIKKKKIAYMPRKNPRDSSILSGLISNHPYLKDYELVAIDSCTHEQVLNQLSESLVFLSFGHPEGFGLPLAEAIASCCAVIGYSGLGGNELFSICAKYGIAFQVDYGDYLGFIHSINSFFAMLQRDKDATLLSLSSAASVVRSSYNFEAMVDSASSALTNIEKHFV